MTAPSGPILFNASAGGSDTAASGLGPSTAVSGTGASTTASSATVDLSADTPDLSGVSAGDLFWIDSTSGRQFSVIASVNDGADTVTCDDTFANTESGRNWGIGGKRSTLEGSAALLLADAKSGWIVELEADETLTTALQWDAAGGSTEDWTIVRGSSGSVKTITQSGSGANVFEIDDANGYLMGLENIKLQHSHATNGHGVSMSGNGQFYARGCVFGDETNPLDRAWTRTGNGPECSFCDCLFQWTDDGAIYGANSGVHMSVNGCEFYKCSSGMVSHGIHKVTNSIFWENDNYGIDLNSTAWLFAVGNTIHGNGAGGIRIGNPVSCYVIINNTITGNTGYGITAIADSEHHFIDYNNYGTGATANSSGATNNVDKGPNDLEVDPGYADAANGDFSPGVNLKAAGFPGAFRGGNSTSYLDIGGVQREEPAGSAQAKLRRLMHIAEGVL